ncbi:MAG: hypothetical protein A2252_00290 [Elusimicrobia bacterium RIFOXYA2_FULL_39_19]|nr:MAG: hypothetical protein A2252_00290 [Elusimicrobia bacterium RIFOXYA2_FULL_39_19]
MKELIAGRLEGLQPQMKGFAKKLEELSTTNRKLADFNDVVVEEMKQLDFDEFRQDKFDNTMGIIKGYRQEKDIAIIFHTNYTQKDSTQSSCSYQPGVITALYSAALLKRTLLPLYGDIIVCGVPRSNSCEFGIKYLFNSFLAKRAKRLKGIILCEPTDMNVYLGHKGRMEYEISVRLKLTNNFLSSTGVNMLGTMFPLIHELENVSNNMPSNCTLGKSSLRIKDVRFTGTQPNTEENEFKIIVDRAYIPEEQQENILERAKLIAESVYNKETAVNVQTMVASEKIKTGSGIKLVSKKETKPWTMAANHPFVLESMQALTDNGFKTDVGYWKKTFTEGSYTFAELGIPTLGFGPGREDMADDFTKEKTGSLIKNAVHAQTMMIHRNIGMPVLGWNSDEL